MVLEHMVQDHMVLHLKSRSKSLKSEPLEPPLVMSLIYIHVIVDISTKHRVLQKTMISTEDMQHFAKLNFANNVLIRECHECQ